ncbi:MAG: TIGR03960 family B12-binding radical SAM protein [Planctomycetota bacterium]|jgi:radical SAM family uncharacterized protein|nr:TIGR03960 family B12-binding radical SAM protein [Planctomycetota bacterium]
MSISSLLLKVNSPAQYVGGEVNTAGKRDAKKKIALAFPDLYHVGMSNLGLQILREVANAVPDWSAERVFHPAPDMERELRAAGLPLGSLESGTPLKSFDALGVSLACELHAAALPSLLDLGGVAPLAAERDDAAPIVIAGGHATFNPEIFADFVDAFAIGDGEEVFAEILRTLGGFDSTAPRRDKLTALAQIAGVYVPSLYPTRIVNGIVAPVLPAKIARRVVADLDAAPVSLAPIVPLVETAHERVVLEIMRGCPNGCRFCQAGQINRPVRYRSVATLLAHADAIYRATGYDEIGLLSLSSSDYPHLEELTTALDAKFAPLGVGLSLPSLRVNSKLLDLPRRLQTVRKSGLTFAPEAGSDRLRAVINKRVTNEDLLAGCEEAFRRGWKAVKLYFMLGLPTETDDDVLAIAELCNAAAGRRGKITCAVGNFIPKPFTPLQWCPMTAPEILRARQQLLLRSVNRRAVDCKCHDIEVSVLEAALARGDRRLGKVILAAWQNGARLDNWSEHFNRAAWEKAFAENGLTPAEFAEREFSPDAILPWSHLDAANEDWLRREYDGIGKSE